MYEQTHVDRTCAETFLQDTLQHHASGPTPLARHQPLSSFVQAMKASLGLAMVQKFFCWIQVASVSVDSLEDLMVSIKQAFAALDRHSTCGTYLWSISLGYDELSFESVTLLWQDLRAQVTSVDFRDDFEVVDCGPVITCTDGDDRSDLWPLSKEQLSERLQREIQPGHTPSNETLEALESVLQSHPELPMAHFLHFYCSVVAGEREAAVDALHQYLDHSFDAGSILQYAAIITAILHYSFGDCEMSRAATDEAVRVAQQSQDTSSVAFALGWLALVDGQPNANEVSGLHSVARQELIHRCVKRASECSLRSLAAGANMVLSQVCQTTAFHSNVWEFLSNALTDEVATDGSSGLDRPTQMANVHSGEDAFGVLTRQRMVAAGLWDAAGHQPMSKLSTKTVLQAQNQRNKLAIHDIGIAIQNFARSSLFGSTAQYDSNSNSGHHDIQPQLQESYNLTSEASNRCAYALALKKLIGLRQLFHLPVKGALLHEIGLHLHEWAVRRGELSNAESLATLLSNRLCPSLPNYEQIKLDVGSQNALRLARQGHWDRAKTLLHNLVSQCEKESRSFEQAKLLLQLGGVMLESDPGFTPALPSILECLDLTESCNFNGLRAAALTLLGQVHLRMKNPTRAIAVIESALPTLLQHEHIWLQGDAYLALAKCHLQAAHRESVSRSMSGHLSVAALHLSRSSELFQLCEDCVRLREVYYLQARLLESMNAIEQRDDAANRFVAVSQHLLHAKVRQCDMADSLQSVDLRELADQSLKSIQVA